MSVSIWGFGKADRKWRVFTVDFEKVIQRQCKYPYSDLKTSYFTSIIIVKKCEIRILMEYQTSFIVR